ncbi:MAG: erythromycin esterase family protein [Flavobacterium sp.]
MKTKILYTLLLVFFISAAFGQNPNVIGWLKTNTTPIIIEGNQVPTFIDNINKIENVRVFGFGEATHHHSEFFKVKSEIFKELVTKKGVRIFAIEESFGAAHELNKFLKSNVPGDPKDLLLNFKQKIWPTEEMYQLLRWIKSYNDKQSESEKITFHGIDTMFNYKIIDILSDLITEANIILDDDSKSMLKFYAKENFLPNEKTGVVHNDEKIISTITLLIINSNLNLPKKTEALNSLYALTSYIKYIRKPNQKDRDEDMAANVIRILNQNPIDSKIFIWAHNEHIKKTYLFNNKIPTMGSLLSKELGNQYYSVGFEFGIGELMGLNESGNWEVYTIDKPIKNTESSTTFSRVREGNYFFDFEHAIKDPTMKSFLQKKSNYVVIGGLGLLLKYVKYSLATENYLDMYNGLIYINNISRSSPIKKS